MASGFWLNTNVFYRLRLHDMLSREVRTRLVSAYYGQTTMRVLIANVFCALLMAGLLWPTAPKHLLAVWALSVLALTVISATVSVAYSAARDADLHPDKWAAIFLLLAFSNGAAWGAAGVMFFDPAAPAASMIVVVGLACVAAGATASKTAILSAGLAFVFSALGPLFVLLLADGSGECISLAIIIAVYSGALTIFSAASNQVLWKSAQLAQLNDDLLDRQQRDEAYFHAVVESVADFVAVIGADGTILFHTSASKRLLQWPTEEMTGRLFLDFVHPEDADELKADVALLVTDPKAFVGRDVRIQRQRGEWFPLKVQVRALPEVLPNQGAVVLSAWDVSGYQLKEGAEKIGYSNSTFGDGRNQNVRPIGFLEDIVVEPEFVPLLPSFFRSLEQDIAQLRRAVAVGDRDQLRRLADQSRSNAMVFGFSGVMNVLRELEIAAASARQPSLEYNSYAGVSEMSLEDRVVIVEAEAASLRRRLVMAGLFGTKDTAGQERPQVQAL